MSSLKITVNGAPTTIQLGTLSAAVNAQITRAVTQSGASATTAMQQAQAAAGAATTAGQHADTATAQAGIALTQSDIATEQAGVASGHADTATAQAGIATAQAGIATGAAAGAATQAAANVQVALATSQAAAALSENNAASSATAANASYLAALGLAGAYSTTAAGIAATVPGKLFGIPSASQLGALDLYQNNGGVAQSTGVTLPNLAAVQAIQTGLGANSTLTLNAVATTSPELAQSNLYANALTGIYLTGSGSAAGPIFSQSPAVSALQTQVAALQGQVAPMQTSVTALQIATGAAAQLTLDSIAITNPEIFQSNLYADAIHGAYVLGSGTSAGPIFVQPAAIAMLQTQVSALQGQVAPMMVTVGDLTPMMFTALSTTNPEVVQANLYADALSGTYLTGSGVSTNIFSTKVSAADAMQNAALLGRLIKTEPAAQQSNLYADAISSLYATGAGTSSQIFPALSEGKPGSPAMLYEWNHIPCYGQSRSIGWVGYPPQSLVQRMDSMMFGDTGVITGTLNWGITVVNSTTYTCQVQDFVFADQSGNPSATLAAISIQSLPLSGTLALNGTPVTVGQNITVAQISAGQLVYTPQAGFTGSGDFLYQTVGSVVVGYANQTFYIAVVATGTTSAKAAPRAHTSLVPLVEGATETPTSGIFEALKERIKSVYGLYFTEQNFRFIGSCAGFGGRTIGQINKGTNFYTCLLNDITSAKALADAAGKTYGVPAMIWLQAEQNFSTPQATYLSAWRQFKSDFNADVKAITGQTADVLFVTEMPSSMGEYGVTYPLSDFALAQSAQQDADTALSGPAYFYDYTNAAHLTGSSYKWCGALLGSMLFDFWLGGGAKPTPLNVVGTTRLGNTLLLTLNRPYVVDNVRVSAALQSGFRLISSGGAEIPMTVSFPSPLTIKLVAASSPVGAALSYACMSDNPSFNVTSSNIRFQGPRGNIRDASGDTLIFNGGGLNFPLNRWLTMFSQTVI